MPIAIPIIQSGFKRSLESQGYRFTGNHSATKVCHWTKASLRGEGSCYKSKFYGINSHQCVQMTPNMFCPNKCDFCWRDMDACNEVKMGPELDDPNKIIDNSITEQYKALTGFKGNPEVEVIRYVESLQTKHFAISLTGEPTMYPYLPTFIKTLRQRGITSFLVSNGQFPDAIERLKEENAEPTQLYISLDAPTKEIYLRLDKPMMQDFWERYTKSLEIMATLKTRTVLRITAVKGLNMCEEGSYALLIKRANPRFVEIKGFMLVGAASKRLAPDNMPTHEEILTFARRIERESGYNIVDEAKESRAILLMKGEGGRFLEEV